MPIITVDSREFQQLRSDARKAPAEQKRRAFRALRETTMETVRFVKVMMPVDTGRARASWGLWTADLRRPNPDAKASDAILRQDEANLETVQGSNLPYIEPLNAGHSRQAPRGFLDMAQEAAERWLDERLAKEGLL